MEILTMIIALIVLAMLALILMYLDIAKKNQVVSAKLLQQILDKIDKK